MIATNSHFTNSVNYFTCILASARGYGPVIGACMFCFINPLMLTCFFKALATQFQTVSQQVLKVLLQVLAQLQVAHYQLYLF